MLKLTEKEIESSSAKLKGWTIVEGQLHKKFAFKDFREAMSFITKVALTAESMDHHPDIDIRYNKVTLNVLTHSAGGLTEKDFTLAQAIDS